MFPCLSGAHNVFRICTEFSNKIGDFCRNRKACWKIDEILKKNEGFTFVKTKTFPNTLKPKILVKNWRVLLGMQEAVEDADFCRKLENV